MVVKSQPKSKVVAKTGPQKINKIRKVAFGGSFKKWNGIKLPFEVLNFRFEYHTQKTIFLDHGDKTLSQLLQK